jgi:Asp-tRNA(Asn)/Glu-tRNA(Gln) amidotransferase C subunit
MVMFSFYLLSQLLSKEEEVSTISRSFASVINKIEYSKAYFIKMMENEYSSLKGNLREEEIVNRLQKKYKVEIGNVATEFEVHKINKENGALRLEILQKSVYSNSVFSIEANSTFTLYFR